jgi:hypothetical protein
LKAYIKISKKNATKEEEEELYKLLDKAGIKYYKLDEIER